MENASSDLNGNTCPDITLGRLHRLNVKVGLRGVSAVPDFSQGFSRLYSRTWANHNRTAAKVSQEKPSSIIGLKYNMISGRVFYIALADGHIGQAIDHINNQARDW
jgi:hypothetical protein